MKNIFSRVQRLPGLVLLIPALICGNGCDYFNLSGSSSDPLGPSSNTGSHVNATSAPAASSGSTSSAAVQEPEPQAAAPEPVVSNTEFAWIPGSDSVVVKIPAKYAHWQFLIVSRRKHVTLYGPDNRGGNKAQEVVYTLQGGGAAWRQKSLDAKDDGTLMVFINTKDVPPGGEYRNAAWRIMNPMAAQYGDGNRLMPGDGNR